MAGFVDLHGEPGNQKYEDRLSDAVGPFIRKSLQAPSSAAALEDIISTSRYVEFVNVYHSPIPSHRRHQVVSPSSPGSSGSVEGGLWRTVQDFR